jgi:hypothetical protein
VFESAVAATMDTLYPKNGPVTGGTMVTIEGTGFTSETQCRFGSVLVDSELISTSRITCATPPSISSEVDVTMPGVSDGLTFSFEQVFTQSLKSGYTFTGEHLQVVTNGANDGSWFKCMFNSVVQVDAVKQCSNGIVECVVPAIPHSNVTVSLTLNGVDYSPTSQTQSYIAMGYCRDNTFHNTI